MAVTNGKCYEIAYEFYVAHYLCLVKHLHCCHIIKMGTHQIIKLLLLPFSYFILVLFLYSNIPIYYIWNYYL